MSKWKQFTEQEFTNIKKMQEAGLTAVQVVRITGRANGTVNRVFKHENLTEYRNAINEQWKKYQKPTPVVEKREVHKVQLAGTKTPGLVDMTAAKPATKVPEVPQSLQDAIHRNNELVALNRIAKAIEALTEAWNSAPKRGIFH